MTATAAPARTLSTEYNAVWKRRHRRLVAYGRWVDPFVPIDAAAAHIADLRATYGIGLEGVATLGGFSQGHLDPIVLPNHPARRVKIRRETEERILAIRFDLDRLGDHQILSVVGTQRRIRALARIGWSGLYLAERLGVTHVGQYATGHSRKFVTARRARDIRDLYDELSMTPGPSRQAITQARARGYAPPLAWDDDTIDRIDAVPVGVDDPDVTCRPRPVAETVADIEWHLSNVDGFATLETIARRLGRKENTLEMACRRAGRIDLLHRLGCNARGFIT